MFSTADEVAKLVNTQERLPFRRGVCGAKKRSACEKTYFIFGRRVAAARGSGGEFEMGGHP